MKIYFTASIVGRKQYLTNYLKIIDAVRNSGHEIAADHIIKAQENQIFTQSEKDRLNFHNTLRKWIMESDCMIVETSFPSISVGFEISLALNSGKPVLVLYTKTAPTLLFNYNDEKLICEKYDPAGLDGIVKDFLNYAAGTSDSRFTFYVSSRMTDFLDKVSVAKKIPKSVYIRSLIEKEMRLKK